MRAKAMLKRRAALLTGFALLLFATPGQSAAPPPLSVCAASESATKFIGKRVRVEGYIFDLSSHGFVLASDRTCKSRGQLKLVIKNGVYESEVWRKAFAKSLGPKRAILVGIVHWRDARAGGRAPALLVERVEYIANREADLKSF